MPAARGALSVSFHDHCPWDQRGEWTSGPPGGPEHNLKNLESFSRRVVGGLLSVGPP